METDVYGRASGNSSKQFITAMIHTRCPSCRKLFTIDPLPLTSEVTSEVTSEATADTALFQCPACDVQFTVGATAFVDSEAVGGERMGVVWAESHPVEMKRTTPPTQVSHQVGPEIGRGPLGEESTPHQPRLAAEPAPLAHSVRTEPTRSTSGRTDTHSTDKTTPDEEAFAAELALGAKPELILLWKGIIDHYEEAAKHDAFLNACAKHGALAYAAHKYGRILRQFPDEEIALAMRKRLVALANAPMETTRVSALAGNPAREKSTDSAAPAGRLRVMGLNSIVILLGTVVSGMGIAIPGLQNMTGVGVAMVALALGLRFVR